MNSKAFNQQKELQKMLHAECEKKIKAGYGRLQEADESLTSREDAANSKRAELKSTPGVKITKEQRAEVIALNDELFAIDQDRIALKSEWLTFRIGPLTADLKAISLRKAKGPSEAEKAVRNLLVSIGFIDTYPTEYGAIQPEWILHHPLFRQAAQETEDAAGAVAQNEIMIRADRESLEADLARLEAKKLKLFSF